MTLKRFLFAIVAVCLVQTYLDYSRQSPTDLVPWWAIGPLAAIYTLICAWIGHNLIRPQNRKQELAMYLVMFLLPLAILFLARPEILRIFHAPPEAYRRGLVWIGQNLAGNLGAIVAAWLLDKITSRIIWRLIVIVWALMLGLGALFLLLILATMGPAYLMSLASPTAIPAGLIAMLGTALTTLLTRNRLVLILVFMGFYMGTSSLLGSQLEWWSLLIASFHCAITTLLFSRWHIQRDENQ